MLSSKKPEYRCSQVFKLLKILSLHIRLVTGIDLRKISTEKTAKHRFETPEDVPCSKTDTGINESQAISSVLYDTSKSDRSTLSSESFSDRLKNMQMISSFELIKCPPVLFFVDELSRKTKKSSA